MLYSQGIPMETLRGGANPKKAQEVWRLFAANYHLFRGTPTRLWLDYAFQELFGLQVRLKRKRRISIGKQSRRSWPMKTFRPRALYERFQH